MIPATSHERYYQKVRAQHLENFMNDKEAVDALKLIMDRGYVSRTITEAYFIIKGNKNDK